MVFPSRFRPHFRPVSAPVVLTIAGSDCSAGAGIQADLKTFHALGCFGLTAVTAVVAETPRRVRSVHPVPPPILQDQLELLLEGYPIAAIKTGMLVSKPHLVAVTEILARHPGIPLVVDPVMVASSGDPLLESDAVAAYLDRLLPLATLITPNLDEAAILAKQPISSEAGLEEAARGLHLALGTAVLLKGGHLEGADCADLLWDRDGPRWLRGPRLDTPASHGTGCTLSAAIAARLAHGASTAEAVAAGKAFITRALAHALDFDGLAHLDQFPPD